MGRRGAAPAFSPKHEAEDEIGHPAEGRTDQAGKIPLGLREDAFDMAQGLEPFFTVVGAMPLGRRHRRGDRPPRPDRRGAGARHGRAGLELFAARSRPSRGRLP
jgi:hypothetical protein